MTDSLGHTTLYESDGRGVVVREVDPLGGEKLKEYDEALQRVSETDELGHTTVYEYDSRGNRTKVVGPDGAMVELRYTARNLPEEATDANGGTWRWRYDQSGQLLEETNPLQETRRYEYSGGLLTAEVGPGGERTEYAYDAQYNPARVRLPTGGQVRWEHDRRGRRIASRDPRGAWERVRYDLLDRPVREEGPGGEAWEHRYDAEGNLLEASGPLRHVKLGYTGFHWPAFREEAGTRLGWRHDAEGRLVEMTNEAGEVYRFTRDEVGRVVREEGFDGAVWRYAYDAAGRLVQAHSPSGRTRHLSYDAAGRLTRAEYDDGTFRAFRYRRDGALVEAENESSTVVLERDALGRVVSEKQADGEVSSSYSSAGHRVEIDSSLGAHQELLRDGLGQVRGVKYRSPGRPEWAVRMERDAGGLEVSRWMPGGVAATWRHDESGRLTERRTLVGGGVVAHRTWHWRSEGQLAAVSDVARGRTTEYRHDARGRLVGERRPDGSFQHRAMDAVGNLYREPGRRDRRYSAGGRLQEADGTRYVHDADGHLTEKHTAEGTWRYGWNGAGLLSEVQRPDGVSVHLSYDALARRTVKRVMHATASGLMASSGSEVRFIWDGEVPLHEVSSSKDVTTWLFEPESFSPMGSEDGTGRYCVVTDHLGAPTEMYDELGQLAWRMQLDVFGVGQADVALRHCPWRWPGQYEDAETGLLYNRFRYYDAEAGRYMSPDPLGAEGGPLPYGYPDDPFSAIDPLGLSATPLPVPKPGEPLYVGTYNSSYHANRLTGLGKTYTPHHAIQDAMSPSGVSHGRGITINIPKKGVHDATASFRRPVDRRLGPRAHLARDVRELRQSLVKAGFDARLVRQQLLELIRQNKAAYGSYLDKPKKCK